MNRYCLMKSIIALVLFTANLVLITQATADNSHLSIHIAPETYELLQTPPNNFEADQKKKSVATRQLLSIEASTVIGGGFIVTPHEALLPQMSIRIDENGHMQTICR